MNDMQKVTAIFEREDEQVTPPRTLFTKQKYYCELPIKGTTFTWGGLDWIVDRRHENYDNDSVTITIRKLP